MKVASQMKENANETVAQVTEQLRKLGFDIDPAIVKGLAKGDKESEKLYRMIVGEQKGRKKLDVKDPVTELNEDSNVRHREVTDILKDIRLLLAKLNGQTDINDNQYKDWLGEYQKRYNFVSGLSDIDETKSMRQGNSRVLADGTIIYDDDPEAIFDEVSTVDPETTSLWNRFRIGKSRTKSFLKDTRRKGKTLVKSAYGGAKGKLRDIRNSSFMNSIFGDKSIDWRDPSREISPRYSTRNAIQEDSKNGYKVLADGTIVYDDSKKSSPLKDLTNSIKSVAGTVFALAAKQGVDASSVDTNTDSKTYLSKIKSKFNNVKETVTQFFDGRPMKYVRDNNGDLIPDSSSAENRETQAAIEEKEKTQKGIFHSLTNIPNTLGGLFTKIFGEKDEENKSWFSKLIDKIGTPVKIATAVAASFGVIGWAKDKIYPGLKSFWDEKVSPYLNDAWQGKKEGFGQFIYFFNPKNPNGLLVKFKNFLHEDFPEIMKTASTYIADGMNWALREVFPTVVSTLIKNLPVIAKGLVTGIIDGINGLFFNKVNKNDGKMADLENIESQLGSSSSGLFSGSTSKPSWFDSNVKLSNTTPLSGNVISLSGTKTIAAQTIENINNKANISSSTTPKAFDTMNQVYRSAALTEYEKVKDNIIETPYGPMTVTDILNSDQQFATNTETGEPIYGYQLLNYNNTAQDLGMNIQLSQEEMQSNTRSLGGGNKTTIQSMFGKATLRSFIRGMAGNSTGVKGASKLISGTSKVVGGLSKAIPGVGKIVGSTIQKIGSGAGKFLKSANKYGAKLTGKTIEEAAESAVEAAAGTTKTGAFRKFAAKAADSKLSKFIIKACEALKGWLMDSKVIGPIAEAISKSNSKITKTAIKNAIDKFGDKLVAKIPNILKEYGAKMGLKATGKLSAYILSGTTLMIADAVLSFISGYNNANTILGITRDPDLPFRALCGIIEALNSVFLLGLVPLNIVVDLVVSCADVLGLPLDSLKKERELAKKEVEDYNKEHGTQFDIEDYNKRNSLGTKIKNALSDAGNWIKNLFSGNKATNESVSAPSSAASYTTTTTTTTSNIPSYAASNNVYLGNGSGLVGRASNIKRIISKAQDQQMRYNNNVSRNTFISQIDPRYRDQQFNTAGDTERQTLGDTGCAPAAAAMAINSSLGGNMATMEDSSRFALRYKVKNDGVNATYFNDEFARHGVNAQYITSADTNIRSNEIKRQLAGNNKVVLMGEDASNTSKANSPFGPNPHYVVANGLSKDGKYIYINDPEAKVPNIRYSTSKVLGSSKLGIAANIASGSKLITNKIRGMIGRGTLPGADNAEKCWNFFRSHGFSEIAAAGILGNLQAESSMDPTRLQNGKGPAAGICQWETYKSYSTRWGKMAKYAESKGKDWTDLESQLEYLVTELEEQFKSYTGKTHTYYNGTVTWWPVKLTLDEYKKETNLSDATQIFERVVLRPSIPHREKRLQYAQEFYNRFTGKYTEIDTGTVSNASSSSSGGTIIDKIYSVFGDVAQAWGINTSTSYSNETSDSNSSNITGGVGNETQQKLVNKMTSVKDSLTYSMTGARNPDKGSADCSSTVNWAYKNVTGIDVGNSTPAMYNNSNTTTVDSGDGSSSAKPDESKLQPGDLLLFWRQWAKDQGRNPAVGHVEMYMGDGKQIGHGGPGKGPTIKNLQGNFLRARRLNQFMGKGSGLINMVGRGTNSSNKAPAYDSALKHIKPEQLTSLYPLGYDSEKIDENKISIMQYNNNKLSDTTIRKTNTPTYVGRASRVSTETRVVDKSNVDMIELVKAIIRILVQIVTNTDQLNNITKLLGEYISTAGSSDGSKESKQATIIAKQNLLNAMQSGNGSNSSQPNAQLMALIEATEKIARE